MLPLEGIKALDLSQVLAMPCAGMYLADQGAQVIKVEPPWGDMIRGRGFGNSLKTRSGSTVGRSFLPINRNKKGIVVDIQKPDGKVIIYKLVEKSDVLLHNFRPEACGRLGLDYETLSRINPRLVYSDFTAYGSRGPYANRPGYDRLIQAMTGLYSRRTLPDGTPLNTGVLVADASAPMLVAFGVALALFMREQTGRGQRVETSLLAAALAMQVPELVAVPGEEQVASSSSAAQNRNQATTNVYRCADQRYIVFAIVLDKHWEDFCRSAGVGHLSKDRLFYNAQKRLENSETLYSIMEGILSTKSQDEWMRIFEENDVPAAPVLSPDAVLNHPQLEANELVIEVDDPRVAKVKMVGVPVKLSDATYPSIRIVAPDLGAHTDEILRDIGYSRNQIDELRKKGVVA